MMPHRLAIVIPAYKATFLPAALDSIAAQTCHDFTLYVGDDASPYDIRGIVDGYRDRMDVVYRRFEENVGGRDLVAQWERCIAMSRGEDYIWLFSDDDVMEANCVERLYQTIRDTKEAFDLYHFDVDIVDAQGRLIRRKSDYPPVIAAYDFYKGKSSDKYASYVVEYVFSRKGYQRVGGFLPFDLAWGSDVATWCKLGDAKGICTIPGARVHWRQSAENITPDNSMSVAERKLAAHCAFFAWAYDYFHDEPDIYAVNRNLFIYKMQSTYRPYVSRGARTRAFDMFFATHGYAGRRWVVLLCSMLPRKVYYLLRRFNFPLFRKDI